MKNRRRTDMALLLAVLPIAAASHAATREQNDTTAVLAGFMNTSGGVHWSDITSLHLIMTVTSGGMTGHGDRWEDLKTGRYVECISWPDLSTYNGFNGFNGITPWRQGRSGTAYTLGDIDAALVSADESFRAAHAWWFPDRHPATIASTGTRLENGHRFDILDVTPEGGRKFDAWIDDATHLLARTDEQQAEDRVVTAYGDYRLVHGVMLPFSIRSGDGLDPAFAEVETVQTVEVNPVFFDSIYGVPPRPAMDVELPPHHDRVEVPFQLTARNRIMVPLTIDGHATVAAEFDSGGSLVLQPATIAALDIVADGQSKQGGNFEGATTARNGRLDSVAIGGAIAHHVAFHSYGFAPGEPNKALVGLECRHGILRQFNLTFDYDRQRIILVPNHLYGHKDIFNRAGFRLQQQGAVWSISTVYPGSPAADAGLQPGDVVLSIDGQTAETLGSDSLWSRFEAPVGKRLTLRVRSARGERPLILTLRDLL